MTTYASFCTAADCRTCTDPCLGHMVTEPPMAGMPWDDDDPEGPQGPSTTSPKEDDMDDADRYQLAYEAHVDELFSALYDYGPALAPDMADPADYDPRADGWDPDDDPEGPQGSSPDDVFENEDGFLERRACATCYWRGSFYNCPGAEECRI